MNPKHIDEVPNDRRAIAPYNFVQLPDRVVAAELPLLEGDRYHLERKIGKFECTLTTESPLYIRCGLTNDEFKLGKEAKDLPDFFYTNLNAKTENPVLPGSSLRGMLRTLIEIVSFGKIERVSGNQRLFFRAVAADPKKDSLAAEYQQYVLPKNIQAGYLQKDSHGCQGWSIQPATKIKEATFAWVRESDISLPDFKKFNNTEYQPQYIDISYETVSIDHNDRAKRLFASNVNLPNTYPNNKGKLVTSGNMKQGYESSPRCNHSIVFAKDESVPSFKIDHTAIEHYRNGLTDFQKKSPFDKDWGVLQEKEDHPVFYYQEKNSNIVGFFGQSPNFRIPYSPQGNGHATTVLDFIPEDLRTLASIDIADAIFGWVKQESESQKLPANFDKQRAGRVFFTDASHHSNQNGIWYEDNPVTPQILSEPKSSNFPHYLVQINADKSQLKHYASEPVKKTVIRGHKLYWHKGSNPDLTPPRQKKVIGVPQKVSDTQTTQINPIKKGVTFKFNIHFENLSEVELGALLWVLSLSSNKSQELGTGKQGEKYCFSLGMGKPLGMGAVKIDYELHLSDRTSRYSNLFDGTKWKTGEEDQSQTDTKEQECVKAFEKYVLDGISERDYPKERNREQLQHLKQLPRIEMLLAMLRCDKDKIPDEEQTRYMELEEFKQRKVLPTPLDVMNILDNRRFASVESQLTTKISNKSTLPKPQPKNTSERGRDEDGGNINLAFQRPPNKPKR